jgi:hypothetical protein
MKHWAVVFPSGSALLTVTLLEVDVIVVSVLIGVTAPPLAAWLPRGQTANPTSSATATISSFIREMVAMVATSC